MTTSFPKRWPAQHPDHIQLYSLATPNGKKVGIALEELDLPYEAHRINIMECDQFDPDFVAINPNSKIPAIIDPNGPDGEAVSVFESGAILQYLVDKAGGRLLPSSKRGRIEANKWLFFQMAGIGPTFGQFGHFFKFARNKTSDSYALERYTAETKRLLGVLDKRLDGRPYLAGDVYSIADIATFPWIMVLDFYGGKETLDYDTFENVQPWVDRCLKRPAVQRGIKVCSSD